MIRRKAMRGLWAATALSLFAFSGAAEARTNRALLVAVTAYPNLPPQTALVGPNHDAALVRDFLTAETAPVKFDAANVTVLADGLDGAKGSPTHAAILSALKDLAATAERDDFVYIHMSGHGAQQPALVKGAETDGMDEIFLPSDTRMWENQEKGVPNALIDDEIGPALDAIRDKGAFVWLVVDACHSGTATRAAPVDADEMVERKVEASTLGIPDAAMAQALADAAPATRGVGGAEATRQAAFKLDTGEAQPTSAESIAKGGMVAFFAAQTVETTPEMPLPKGEPDATRFGLFTYTIFSKLAENPGVTYRQLGAAVLQQYGANGMPRPTPLFEGTLDAPVFGSEAGETVMQWPLDVRDNGASVAAGLLHRLSPGTRLAILPSPASSIDEALGYMEVKSAKNLSAKLAPVAFEDKPAVKLADLPPKPYVRLAELAVDFNLTVARPAAQPGLEATIADVDAALTALAQDKARRFNIALVEPGAAADVRLAVLPESAVSEGAPDTPALFFLPPSGEIDKGAANRPPKVALGDASKLEIGLGGNLTKIFRAVSLSQLAAASSYGPDEVSVRFELKDPETNKSEALDPSAVPLAHPGNQVWIDAENKSTRPVDINVLYVGSDYSITHIAAERLMPGARLADGMLQFTGDTFGTERMIAVLTEAPPQSPLEDLSFLAQDGVRAAGVKVPRGGIADLIEEIGAPSTRSAMKLSAKRGTPKGAVMIFSLETRPAG